MILMVLLQGGTGMRSRTRGLRGRGAVMSFHIYRFPFIHLYTPVTPIDSVSNFNSSAHALQLEPPG